MINFIKRIICDHFCTREIFVQTGEENYVEVKCEWCHKSLKKVRAGSDKE